MSIYLSFALIAFICSVVSSVLGYIWYGPVFGKLYASIMGMDMNNPEKMAQGKKMMPVMMLINFLGTFILFYAFSFAAAILVNPNFLKGIMIFALFIWAGFLIPMVISNSLWSGKSPKMSLQLFLIGAAYQLISILLAGFVWMTAYPYLLQ